MPKVGNNPNIYKKKNGNTSYNIFIEWHITQHKKRQISNVKHRLISKTLCWKSNEDTGIYTLYDFIYTKHLEQGKLSYSYGNHSCLKVEVARGSGGDHLERGTEMLGIVFICKP